MSEEDELDNLVDFEIAVEKVFHWTGHFVASAINLAVRNSQANHTRLVDAGDQLGHAVNMLLREVERE